MTWSKIIQGLKSKYNIFCYFPHIKRENFNSILKETRLLDIFLPHEPRLPIKLDTIQTQQRTAFCGSYNQVQERNYKETQCGCIAGGLKFIERRKETRCD